MLCSVLVHPGTHSSPIHMYSLILNIESMQFLYSAINIFVAHIHLGLNHQHNGRLSELS
jgi:hypothetical protein